MPEPVHGVKNLSSKCKRNVRPRWTVADIDQKLVLTDVDSFEIESTPARVSQLSEFWVGGLLGSNFGPINAQVSDGIDHEYQVVRRSFLFPRRLGDMSFP